MSALFHPFCLLIAFCFICYTPVPLQAQDADRYGQWHSSDKQLQEMIKELDQIIDEGSRARAAHPGFLQDLQDIVERYRVPNRIVHFSDDFADNDFTDNPAWFVRSGNFKIDRFGALFSNVAVRRPVADNEEPESEGDKNLRILLGVLNELAKDSNEQQGGASQAVIGSSASIPNSFTLEFTFKSNADWGSTSIGVIMGDDPLSGYHLVYQASPADNRPMQLIKYRYGKQYIIDEIVVNSPNLDDGIDHTAQLSRTPNGDMIVTIDGTEVMRTADFSYRDSFSGVMIVNRGGSYSYDNIEFFSEQ